MVIILYCYCLCFDSNAPGNIQVSGAILPSVSDRRNRGHRERSETMNGLWETAREGITGDIDKSNIVMLY